MEDPVSSDESQEVPESVTSHAPGCPVDGAPSDDSLLVLLNPVAATLLGARAEPGPNGGGNVGVGPHVASMDEPVLTDLCQPVLTVINETESG